MISRLVLRVQGRVTGSVDKLNERGWRSMEGRLTRKSMRDESRECAWMIRGSVGVRETRGPVSLRNRLAPATDQASRSSDQLVEWTLTFDVPPRRVLLRFSVTFPCETSTRQRQTITCLERSTRPKLSEGSTFSTCTHRCQDFLRLRPMQITISLDTIRQIIFYSGVIVHRKI